MEDLPAKDFQPGRFPRSKGTRPPQSQAKTQDPHQQPKRESNLKTQRLLKVAIPVVLTMTVALLFTMQSSLFQKISNTSALLSTSDNAAIPKINPYKVDDFNHKATGHGPQSYYLVRDANIKDADYLVTGGNDYVNNVTVEASLLSYESAKIQIFQSKNYHGSYHVPQEYLAQDYLKDYNQGLFFNQLGFQVNLTDTFHMRLYDKHNNFDYVTTQGEPFLFMNYFVQIGYKIESQRLFGLGERTRTFQLQEGSYIMYPQNNGDIIDTGLNKDPAQQTGQHPFLIAQLRGNQTFFGIYVMSSTALQVGITYTTEQYEEEGQTVTKYFSHVVFNTNGGALDTFYFFGPTYQDVLRQYHAVIGKPIMPPVMSHGLYLSNDVLYAGSDALDKIITYGNQRSVPIEGVVIPPFRVDNQYIFNINYPNMYKLSDLHYKYPGLKWIYPFSTFIPQYYLPYTITDKNLVITVNGTYLQVTDSIKGVGFCFDYLNPNSTQFLEQIFYDSHFDFNTDGLWLYNNAPTFSSTQYDGKNLPVDVNPFKSIPFWPGATNTYLRTMPAYAKSNIYWNGTDMTSQYHFYLHGLYATEMGSKIQWAASEKANSAQALIISDGTFPGAGARGLAHVHPKQALTADSLKLAVSQLLNFNMFGMPYTSHNVCGYTRGSAFSAEMESLCVRSFQIAVVSPFAVYNTNGADISSLSEAGQQNVKSILQARLALVNYQRTELYKLQNIGGALIRPLFAEYPSLSFFTPDTLDTVMFGDCIKVDFSFNPAATSKDVYLPTSSYWLDLYKFELVYVDDGQTSVTMNYPLTHPIALQKQGTIVSIQNVIKTNARFTSSLKNTPLTLSVLLDQNELTAAGHVLIEDGKDQQEFYEVKATIHQISFKQHNDGSVDRSQGNKNIEEIAITSAPLTIYHYNVACALLQDHETIQPLYLNAFSNDVLYITPNDPNNKDDKTTLNIQDVAFIFYGRNDDITFECNQNLMQSKVKLDILKGDYTRELLISQNIKSIVSDTPDLNFQITIEDDNTLSLSFFPHGYSEEAKEFRQQFHNGKVGDPSFTLDKVVTINNDPFYIEVHSYQDTPEAPKTVYWTTKNTSFIFHEDYSMFNYIQPNTNADRYFGIGERKGEFYLQDNYQYSLHTNNINLKDMKQGGRTVQFCKNGFFPIIFAQDVSSPSQMMAVYLGEGSKDIFFTKKFGKVKVPKFAVVQMVNFLNMRIIFDQHPTQLMRDLHRSIQPPQNLKIPPTWALGQYHLVKNFEDSGEFTAHQDFYSKIGWPLEGFLLDQNFTDFETLRLSPYKIEGGNYNFTLSYLNQKNLTIWQIMKAGIPKVSSQANYLIQNSSTIEKEPFRIGNHNPVVGMDSQGEVIYANYYSTNFALDDYQEGAFKYYENTYIHHSYGVQLINNEIYEPFCTQDCFRDNQYDPMPKQFYKVGVDAILRHSLSANAVKNVDKHNGYGFRQQLRLSHLDFYEKKFFLSSSNTPGSGRLGNIGRLIDYIDSADDPQVAVVALQSLSLLGMGAIGEQYGSVIEKVGSKAVNQHIIIQTFSPLAAHQWQQTNPKGIDDIMAGPLVRYKYMLIKYTQSLLFRQTYLGDPLIHPLFMDFYNDDKTFSNDVIQNQYMYGDFLVSIQANQKGVGTYFPAGTWCTTSNYNADPLCLNSTGQSIQIQSRIFFFKSGSIVPLQDVFGKVYAEKTDKKITNTTKDLINLPIDLHMNIESDATGDLFFSRGSLLLYTDDSDYDPHCYIEMIHNGDTVHFELKVGRTIEECKYQGYTAGRVYIYNPAIFKYTQVKVNGDDSKITPIVPGVNQHYKYFEIFKINGQLSWYDIFFMQFI